MSGHLNSIRKATPLRALTRDAANQLPDPTDVPTPAKRPFRKDIQGLRAILMIQVLLYHAWTIGSPIGVDSFIMISAYLLTSSFVRRTEAGAMPGLVDRWATTFKRLLPALATSVVAIMVGVLLFLPSGRWREASVQAFASMTYWENWRLVQVSADYYAQEHGVASPFQHLWSMSMQGQMFLLWPLLMVLCAVLARKVGWDVRKAIIVAFSVLTVASLIWLLTEGRTDPGVYFDTRSRIWEFAFGSAIAAAEPYLHVPQRWRKLVTWLALGVLVLFSLVSIGDYPGPMAFFPLIAVSLLLLAPAAGNNTASGFLSAGPLVALGNISYAVYLVHWPIFIFFLAWRGVPALSLKSGAVLIAVSIVAAWLLTNLIENPLQRWRWASSSTGAKLWVVAASIIVGLVPALGVHLYLNVAQARYEARLDALSAEQSQSGNVVTGHPGAAVMVAPEEEYRFTAPVVPGGAEPSVGEWAVFEGNCSEELLELFPEDFEGCQTTEEDGGIGVPVLIGGTSHAQQNIVGQIGALLDQNSWDATALIKGGCHWTLPDDAIPDCREYADAMYEAVEAVDPEYAFLMATWSNSDSPDEKLASGVESLVRDLTSRGIKVFGVRDNLRSEEDLYECSSERPEVEPYGGCLLERDEYFATENPAAFLEQVDGYSNLDFIDLYCTETVCPTIIGNVAVYLDTNHVSWTYGKTMSDYFSFLVNRQLGD